MFTLTDESGGSGFNPRSPWGERLAPPLSPTGISYRFNPRSPWGERLSIPISEEKSNTISIHAPRGGSDDKAGLPILSDKLFQSTLPVGGATGLVRRGRRGYVYFNPRSPWGERL